VFTFSQAVFPQEVAAIHEIEPTGQPNEYTIKTTISGLSGVDIARITYFISKEHTFKKSPSNGLFSKREDTFVKFYIMAVPPSGVIDVELGVLLSEDKSVEFPVEFQYSQNEEKKIVNFLPIKIKGTSPIVVDTLKEEVNDAEEEKAKQEAELVAKQQQKKREEEKKKKEASELLAKQQQEELSLQEKVAEAEKIAQEKALAEEKTPVVDEGKLALEKVVEEKQEEERKIKQEAEEKKIAQEKVAKTKLAEEEKKKEEGTELFDKQEGERLSQEKIIAKEKLVEEEAKQEAELLTKQEAAKKETTTTPEIHADRYAVQILALSKYSEQKVADFCKKNGLSTEKIAIEKLSNLTKVRYGKANTIEEAKELRQEVLEKNISGAFIVKINR